MGARGDPRARLQRGPDQGGLRGPRPSCEGRRRSPNPVRQLRTLKWGLVPSWAKTPEGGARMINARAETVHEKPSYRRAFAAPALHHARRRLLRVGHRRPASASWRSRARRSGRASSRTSSRPPTARSSRWPGCTSSGATARCPTSTRCAWWVTCSVITTEAETTPLARRPRRRAALARRHPPPDAADAHAGPLGRLAGPGPHRRRRPAVAARAAAGGADAGLPGRRTAVSNVRNNGPELLEELEGPEEEHTF